MQSDSTNITVAGKIHEKGEFWRNSLKASKFVMDIIDHGYGLPFESHCPPFTAKNNASSLRNKEFVGEAIEKLLSTGCIREVMDKPNCCNP